MPFPSFILGEKGQISVTVHNSSGLSFSITSASISIQDSSDVYIVEEDECTISGFNIIYSTEFSADNGYSVDEYSIVINAIILSDGIEWTEIYTDTFNVTESKVVTHMSNLVKKMRQYIGDEGESISRNVIGLPDGTRKTFRVHHMFIDQNYLKVYINGTECSDFDIDKNIITFDTAPPLNAAINVDYIYYDYSDEILETCLQSAVTYLNDAANIGWGSFNGSSWDYYSLDHESMIITAAVLEFVSMQSVRLPIAISFGEIGARISIRGASLERQRVIQEVRTILYNKIDEHRDHNMIVDVVT